MRCFLEEVPNAEAIGLCLRDIAVLIGYPFTYIDVDFDMKRAFFTFLIFCSFGFASEPVIDIDVVTGGATNRCYRVKIDDYDLFFRMGDSAKLEYSNATKAYAVGLCPEIFYHNPMLNLLVIPFLNHEKRGLDLSVAALIRTLHHSGIKFDTTFSLFDVIDGYRKHAPENILDEVEKLHSEMGELRQDIPCHLDLHMGNFLFQKERMWMIDWEHAAMGDPLFDLATLASTDMLDQEQTRTFLTLYFEREVTEKELEKFAKMRFLADVRWALWSLDQAETSEVDWDYRGDAEAFMKNAYQYLNRHKTGEKWQ